MKKILLLMAAIAAMSFSVLAQENTIRRIPTVGKDINQEQYENYDRGVWVAAEMLGGISSNLHGHNMELAEFDVTVGYRLSQFLKVGAGLGARYYIDQKYLRRHSSPWSMPLFVAARGNMIPGLYRTVVPYWGCEIGGSIRDGFMMRPTVGLHIGDPRNAFTIGVSYMGQNLPTYNSLGEKDGNSRASSCSAWDMNSKS